LIGRLVESQQALAVAMVGRRLGDATSGLFSAELLALGPTDAPLVVPVIAATGPAILLIDASAPGVAAREVASLDATRSLTRFTLSNIAVGDATVVTHPDAEQAWTVAVGTLVALDATGAARTALTRTLDYSRTREQFGRAIGSFQAYKHRCSSAFIDLRLAQALAFAAADRGSADVAQRAARHCTSRAIHICSEAILLHGGIGFTAEAGLHAFLCRARLDEALACRERQLDQLIVSAATAEPTRS
jgi:alkylation response protein AidB-like acyl-CoA dehydrogenase